MFCQSTLLGKGLYVHSSSTGVPSKVCVLFYLGEYLEHLIVVEQICNAMTAVESLDEQTYIVLHSWFCHRKLRKITTQHGIRQTSALGPFS